jgi:hypothetical protein
MDAQRHWRSPTRRLLGSNGAHDNHGCFSILVLTRTMAAPFYWCTRRTWLRPFYGARGLNGFTNLLVPSLLMDRSTKLVLSLAVAAQNFWRALLLWLLRVDGARTDDGCSNRMVLSGTLAALLFWYAPAAWLALLVWNYQPCWLHVGYGARGGNGCF